MSSPPPIVENPLFFLDYDGTLAPIVADPARAYPHPDVPALLETLAARYPLWIITGRHLRDLEVFLDLSLPAIGLHGMQQGTLGEEADSLASAESVQALEQMRRALPEVEGLVVEDKGDAFAVHYRAADDEEEAQHRLRIWTDPMPQALEAIWGKKVVELRPRELSKGTAVRRIAGEHPARIPVYLGDDVTDEDAFEVLAETAEAITVKIGEGKTTARYRLAGPKAVVEYLRRYAGS